MAPLCWRGDGNDLYLDPAVVFGDLLGPGIVRAQALKESANRQAADGEFLGPFEKSPAINVAVDIKIKQVQQFLREITRLLAFHTVP